MPDKRPIGLGTAFRIDSWSRCITAFHIGEDLFQLDDHEAEPILKKNINLAALDISKLGYGCLSVPKNAWRPLSGLYSLCGKECSPIAPPRILNRTELMVLRIQPAQQSSTGSPFLPVDFHRWTPSKGEEVMALGYAGIDQDQYDLGENRPIRAHLYGSVGRIIDIERVDFDRVRLWPFIRVEAKWPGGMSGGPVFNKLGHVIGVVSTGNEDSSTAVLFSGWDVPQQIFGSIDPVNPGFFYCYGVFEETGELVLCGQDENEIKEFARSRGLVDQCIISINPITHDYVRR
ncbi:hypothetical protein Nmul_A0111 [Nitrosospira multiformis ATCC 25196]|uniref:Trypsin-like peptidase domain-containing protein n=1 Tax=Nitrosospira multiformis (strain ATCC 25196 / NCIMB 11849 / C 71) TaxID=323848 RepID=Q2YCV1_NITMU|nr:hypothetical protein Nmul_A0111 [Nitrosospira multiformis ATCC 25196]